MDIKTKAAITAIEYSLDEYTECGQEFLRCWVDGDFEGCRKVWPSAPVECYQGFDPDIPIPEADIQDDLAENTDEKQAPNY